MSDLPSWCRPHPAAPPDASVVEAGLRAATQGPVAVVGPAGTTVTAAAIAAALQSRTQTDRLCCIRLDESTTTTDAILALGLALGTPLCGDEASVRSDLDSRRTVIFVDDADLAPTAARELVALHPSVSWITSGRAAILGSELKIDGPRVPEGPAPAGWRWLAGLPAGIPSDRDDELPPSLRVALPGRLVLRRRVRERHGRAPGALEDWLEDHRQLLHDVAAGRRLGTPEDLRLYRDALGGTSEVDIQAAAAAAVARLHLQFFQPSEALSALDEWSPRLWPSVGRTELGLLQWLRGDTLLALGGTEEGQLAHLDALHSFRIAGRPQAAVALARRCAERWIALNNPARSRTWLSEARAEIAVHPDSDALADTLRIAGDLAASAREYVGASSLYDEALATISSSTTAPAIRGAILVGRAALHISMGHFGRASADLASADATASPPLTSAAIAYRKAEIGLRRGELDAAQLHLREASIAFRTAGSVRGLMLTERLDGDLAALRGDRPAAVLSYRRAVEHCTRTRDLRGLHTVLRRLVTVESEGEVGPHLDALRQDLELVQVMLQKRS